MSTEQHPSASALSTEANAVPEQQKIAIVIDTNVLIKQIPLRQVINRTLTTDDQFNQMYEVYTLEEVMKEIRD